MRARYAGQELLVLGIVLALSLALVVAIFWTLARRIRRYRLGLVEAEPKCAGCGYIVHPGSGPICPECGGERLKVGVYTPATAPPIFPWPLAVAVYIVLAVAAVWLGPAVAELTPWEWDFRAWQWLDTNDAHAPLTHTGGFSIMASGVATWWGTHIEEIRFGYVSPSASSHMSQAFAPDGRFATDDQEMVRRVLSDAGFVPEDQEGRRVGDQLLSVIRQLRRHEWPAQTPTSGRESDPRYRSGFIDGVLFWVAASLVAGRFIDRWHWRRRERALERKGQLLRDLGLAA